PRQAPTNAGPIEGGHRAREAIGPLRLTFAPMLLGAYRLSATAAAILILSLLWAAAPAIAEGPLYAVPNEPPPEKESVNFTNHLNHRVRHLPPSLDPPTAETPAQVE